ncbi:hypothetical protein [Alteribacter aurantiacus]|uniref:hypothetical protein n=1 Tax=Alteribacter aurantiacus TaxID=254410 RepID=UPI000422B8FB|nr:hypothetical protein [Alteribacter aurantiacus]
MSKKKKPDVPLKRQEEEKEKTRWSYWNKFMLGNNENQGEAKKEDKEAKEDQPPFWWI